MAFDKSQQKVDKILKAADNWGLTIIKAFVFDGTKSVGENSKFENFKMISVIELQGIYSIV